MKAHNMQKLNFSEALELILTVDRRYAADAYQFVREGLDHTLKMLKKQGRTSMRHVRGQELLEGLRQYAIEQFGPLAKTVLEYWGVRRCEDFGEIVFNMVDSGILGKSDEDTRADFKGGYDFEEAFIRPFQPVKRPASHKGTERSGSPSSRRSHDKRDAGPKKLSSGSN